jgi:GUN4-like/NACHT domain
MTDEQGAPGQLETADRQPEATSIVPKDMAPWKVELGKVLWGLVTSGAVTGGGIMAALSGTKLPEIAMGAVAGGIFTGVGAVGYAYVDPLARRAKQGAGEMGNKTVAVLDRTAAQLWARATQAEEKYCLAQAEQCEGYRPEAVRQYDDIRKPMLRDVFVPLVLDVQAMRAGYRCEADDEIAIASMQDDLDIWKLLKRAQTNKEFRRIAVLARGGFGKTTLLRHVAYTFGRGEQGYYDVEPRVPILLLLRKHKKLFAQADIPALPELIQTAHLPSLGRAAELEMRPNWAKEVLEQGRAVVMLDGFDELSMAERSAAALWLNQQMDRYSQCVFIVTSRPKAFNEQPVNSQLDVTMPIWVRDFGAEKQQSFIEKWYRVQERMAVGAPQETEATKREALQEAGKLMAQISERSELKALAINPLLLNMIVTFHRRRPWGTLPALRSDLYREICQLQVVDRPEARDVETVLPGVDTLGILQRLALEMMQRGIQRISPEDLAGLIAGYFQADGETGVEVAQFIEDVVNVTEVLVDQIEEYDFAHLSFQEYLAAAEIARLKQETMLHEKLTDARWKEVVLYYAGLVKNPSNLITRIFDQGNTSLATECLKEAKRVDPEVRALIAALNQRVMVERYRKLEALLKAGKWEEADQETDQVMLQVSGQEDRGFLMPDDFTNFPCEDLRAIDTLWVEASNGHFGFSVQKTIWADCGSPMGGGEDWDRFCDRIGWKRAGKYVSYSDLKKSTSLSPAGELPSNGVGWVSEGKRKVSLFSRSDL